MEAEVFYGSKKQDLRKTIVIEKQKNMSYIKNNMAMG
jgi:hypothetical protein